MRVFTNLNLHGDVPLRVQPEIGEWGPRGTVPARAKKRARWLWIAGFVVVVTLLFVLGHWVYGLIMAAGS